MLLRPRLAAARPLASFFRRHATPRRSFVAAPKEGSGPLMSRRNDRELPTLASSRRWIKTVPLFAVVMTLSTLAIFNYQKASSSIVASTLYALRTNPEARELLGDEIYFANQIPWIWGRMNQMRGTIDISFWVKGTKQKALMRFRSVRREKRGAFKTENWSLRTESGTTVELIQAPGAEPLEQSLIPSTTDA